MEEKIKNILNNNGYNLPEETTLLELIAIINQHKKIEEMLEEANIYIPIKRKVLPV